jgi:hypothetical protein
LAVDTHTWAFRSKTDANIHNKTIKHLSKRFSGSFISDVGKGRYIPFDEMSMDLARQVAGKRILDSVITS